MRLQLVLVGRLQSLLVEPWCSVLRLVARLHSDPFKSHPPIRLLNALALDDNKGETFFIPTNLTTLVHLLWRCYGCLSSVTFAYKRGHNCLVLDSTSRMSVIED